MSDWYLTETGKAIRGPLPYPKMVDITVATPAEIIKAKIKCTPIIDPAPYIAIYEAQEAEEQAKVDTDDEVKGNVILEALSKASPAQIDTWCDNNITNEGEAKEAFKILFKLAAYTLRRVK